MTETSYRGCGVTIKVSMDGPHTIVETRVTGSRTCPLARLDSKSVAFGITEETANEVAFATAVRWIDAIVPLERSRVPMQALG